VWLVLFFFLILGGNALASESGDYLIDVWGAENGLPNSSVTSIAQTPDGYLWVGTYNGLARFDGVRFVNFDPFNTPELTHPRVRRLSVGADGTLWVNTFDGSLTSCRDGKFGLEWKGNGNPDASLTPVSLSRNRLIFLLFSGELIERGVSTNGGPVWKTLQPPGFTTGELAVEDGQGVVWCRGRDQKLWRLEGETFQAAPTNSGLEGQTINSMTTNMEGRLVVGTDKQAACWNNGHFENQTPTNGEPELNVGNISFAPDGDAWIFADEKVRKAHGRQWVFEAEECRGLFSGRLERTGVLEDHAGGSWIHDYGKGLYHVRADGRTRQVSADSNFPGERVDCVYLDREGNFWAGVDRGGLVRLRPRRFTVLQPDDGAAAKGAVSVAEDASGAIWMGTFGSGLYRWSQGRWENFSLAGGFRGGFVFSVFPAANDQLWVSAGEEDLYLLGQGQFNAVRPAVHGVKAILQASDGHLWIGTKSGLNCWTAGQLRVYSPQDGIPRSDIRSLAEDAKGVVWAGGGNGTLYRIESNKVASFRPDGALGAEPIWSLLPDKDGDLWVGTFRGGLLRFRDGHFVRFERKDGLQDDVICQILDDGAGRLWIGSQQGIFRVAKADLNAFAGGRSKSINCTAYGHYDGLPSLECSGNYQPACWRAADGQLLFATLKGVVSVRPEEMTGNSLPPSVIIEEALVDGGPQAFGRQPRQSGSGTEQPVPTLELAPGKQQVEIRYTGLSFVSPDRVRFRYKLDGLDKDWVEAGTRRTAQYSFLRPGDYTFHVVACNNDGVWNGQSAVLLLTVQPHFYERAWFSAALGLAGVALVALLVRQVVVRKLRRQLEYLERQRAVERDRTRIAKDIHDDLGAGLTHITLLSELARRDPEQAGANLERITSSARRLTKAMDEIVWAVDPQHDTIARLMDYISAYSEDFLRVAGVRCRMDMPVELPATRVDAELRYNLFLALKETLNNIVKHAHATEVWLRLRLSPGRLTLEVEDNGHGLNGSVNGAVSERLSSGSGLGNLGKRLEAIGGRCEIHSQPGHGTRVEMTVVLGNGSSPVVALDNNDPTS
jgi:signal transduction histidine kinase/ligand-binding sensor domain-containing protein